MFNLGSKDPVVGKASIMIDCPNEEVFKYIAVDVQVQSIWKGWDNETG